MRYAIYTLGCKVNQYETQALETELLRRGHTLVPFGDEADAYIINTCTVTAVSDRKSRNAIRRAKKRNPAAVVAVCGCYAQTAPEDVAALGVDLVSGTGDRLGFLNEVERLSGLVRAEAELAPEMLVDNIMTHRSFEQLPAGGLEGRTRAMLKVEDGCVNFCTYCIIPYARGEAGPGRLPGDCPHRHRDLLLGPRVPGRHRSHRPGGGRLPGGAGAAGAAGQPGAPHHHRGFLPPGRRPAQPVPPLPPVHAERLRRGFEADEPEI